MALANLNTTLLVHRAGPRTQSRDRARARSWLALATGLVLLTTTSGCLSGPGPISNWVTGGDRTYSKGAPTPSAEPDGKLLACWLNPDRTPHVSGSKAPGAGALVGPVETDRPSGSMGKTAAGADVDASVSAASKTEAPPSSDDPAEKPQASATPEPGTGIGLVLGPEGWKLPKARSIPDADREMEAAEQAYQQGRFSEAEASLHKIAKRRKGNQYGEKAQFLLAESYFQRGKLVQARDAYEILIKDYPGTQYVDKLVEREYAIAQTWLTTSGPAPATPGAPETEPATPASTSDDPALKKTSNSPAESTANTMRRDTAPPPPERLTNIDVQSFASRFDGRRPLFDTGSYAVKLLDQIRLHDPSGPFADDAVMKIADYYRDIGDFEQAAMYYEQLVNDHPKSPLLQKAQRQAIEARLKSYIGPQYDGSSLEAARNMVKQTMVNFPERQVALDEKNSLYNTLDLISEQEAERAFMEGKFYEDLYKPTSAEYYYGKVVATWPNSPWAAKAKEKIAKLAKVPRKQNSLPSRIMTMPGATDANSTNSGGVANTGGIGSGGGMGGP